MTNDHPWSEVWLWVSVCGCLEFCHARLPLSFLCALPLVHSLVCMQRLKIAQNELDRYYLENKGLETKAKGKLETWKYRKMERHIKRIVFLKTDNIPLLLDFPFWHQWGWGPSSGIVPEKQRYIYSDHVKTVMLWLLFVKLMKNTLIRHLQRFSLAILTMYGYSTYWWKYTLMTHNSTI